MSNKPDEKRNNNGIRRKTKADRCASGTKSESKLNGDSSQDAKPLSEADKVTLQQLEKAIGSGLTSFVEVGESLKIIKDSRLYREGSKTFTDYCVSRWLITRQYAYRLIDAAVCYRLLKSKLPSPAVFPLNESQLRPIVGRLEQEQWVKAWKQVIADVGTVAPTANAVAKVVDIMLGETAVKTDTVRKKLRKQMLNNTVAKVTKLVEKALGDKSPTVGQLKCGSH